MTARDTAPRPAKATRRAVALAAHPAGAGLIAGLLTLTVMLFGPPGGDDAAHLYLTQAWRDHGWQLWDNFWYSGRYAQVNYSLLFYPLAALIGLAVAVALAVAGAAAAFAALVRRRWPAVATGPAVAFALLLPLGAVAGTYPFLLGLALALGALAALAYGRTGWAIVAIILTGPAHPLALAFLVAVLGSIAVTGRGWWRERGALAVAAALAGSCVIQAVLLRGFSGGGARYPFDPIDAAAIAGFCIAGLLLTRGLPDQRPLRAVFVGYGVLSAAAFLVSSPLGGNAVRLLLLMGAPLLLLPLSARGFRPRGVAVTLLAGVVLWQALPAVAGWRTVAESRAQNEEFWYPVMAFIDTHHRPGERIQVVATADNWEAFYLARRDVPLARGWFRQDDFPANQALYEDLTPARYASWLRRTAVRYVFLPDDPLDYSARAEAELLRSGRSGLRTVARIGGWTVFEYPDARPIATPADDITVLDLSANAVTLSVRRAGTYRLRVRYTPYWHTEGAPACAAPMDPWGTELRVEQPGFVKLSFDVRLGTFVGAVLGSQGGCATPDDDAPPPVNRSEPLRAAPLVSAAAAGR
jgi:hypothetical protein